MLEFTNFKFIVAIIATVCTVVGFVPYFRDIFAKKTKPHLYTWLIWIITQGTATVALLYGGGRFGSASSIVATILASIIFLLSFKYGTTDIKKSDKIVLVLALGASVIWWQLNNPKLAVLIVSAIDGAGYFPTIRKSFNNPWSETIFFWAMMAIIDLLSIIANAEYNFLTVTYIVTLFVLNTTVVSVCFFRRRIIKKQNNSMEASINVSK